MSCRRCRTTGYLVAASGLEGFRPIYDGLTAVNVYNLNPDEMRKVQTPGAGELLRRDGSNVASVLERLRRERPEVKQRIEKYLSQVVEGVAAVERRSVGAWETIRFRQRVAGDQQPWTFDATSMSDGTLRAPGVLVCLFAGSTALASPVDIEEPEIALHPAATGLLLEALRDASRSRQVLVTTQADPGPQHPASGGARPVMPVPTVAAVVEGHGEVKALPELLRRVAREVFDIPYINVPPPWRLPRNRVPDRQHLASVAWTASKRVPEDVHDALRCSQSFAHFVRNVGRLPDHRNGSP